MQQKTVSRCFLSPVHSLICHFTQQKMVQLGLGSAADDEAAALLPRPPTTARMVLLARKHGGERARWLRF